MKAKHWWLSLMIVIGWVFLLPITGMADGSYTIDKYVANVNVLENGDADFTQRITYNFDGHFNGVFVKQDLKGLKGVDTPQVTVKNQGGSEQTLSEQANGRDNSFQRTQNSNDLQLKVFHKISDKSATFTYRYRLHGVVTNYADTARLNWKVIGQGWDVALNNVHITIKLPAQPVNDLQAWVHGPLNGKTTVKKAAGRVNITVPSIPANQFVETDLLFPTSVTATNSNTVNQPMKEQARKHERDLAAATNRKRQQSQRVNAGMLSAVGAMLVVLLGGSLIYFTRRPVNRHPVPIPVNHWYEVPTVSPAVAARLITDKAPTTKAYTGTLMTEAGNGEITIKPEDKTYIITKQKDISEPLTDFLITEVGDGEYVPLKDLKTFGQRDQSGRLSGRFTSWQDRVEDEARKYYDDHNVALRRWWLTVAIVTSALSALAALIVTNLPTIRLGVWIAAVGLSALVWGSALWQRRVISRYTLEGDQLHNELLGFKRMLNDIGHFDTAKVGDIVIWEQILPYAAALGLAEKVTKALSLEFGSDALMKTGMIFPLYYGFGGFDSSFDTGLSNGLSSSISASNTQASSLSGGSGGFSGGSSGGFGGGSGGGVF